MGINARACPLGSTYNGLYYGRQHYRRTASSTAARIITNMTGRAMLTADARNQSEYGTIRAYIRIGARLLNNADAATFVAERAFIQFAGFTSGQTQSFFDIFSTTERLSYFDAKTSGDTYNYGVKVLCLHGAVRQRLLRHDCCRAGTLYTHLWCGRRIRRGLGGQRRADRWIQPGSVCRISSATCVLTRPWGYVGISGAIHQVAGQVFRNG